MGLFDVIKGYVSQFRDNFSEKIPLDDFGGDLGIDAEDFGSVTGYYDVPDLSDAFDLYDILDEQLGDRIIEDADQIGAGEYVTQFYDGQSASDYVESAPETVLQVYVEWTDDGEIIYHVYRYNSEGE